nr:MAG TPA: hypothetical protein [Caudoviricetes sp.]
MSFINIVQTRSIPYNKGACFSSSLEALLSIKR